MKNLDTEAVMIGTTGLVLDEARQMPTTEPSVENTDSATPEDEWNVDIAHALQKCV